MGNIGKSGNIDVHGVTLTHETAVMCGVALVWAISVHDDLCAHNQLFQNRLNLFFLNIHVFVFVGIATHNSIVGCVFPSLKRRLYKKAWTHRGLVANIKINRLLSLPGDFHQVDFSAWGRVHSMAQRSLSLSEVFIIWKIQVSQESICVRAGVFETVVAAINLYSLTLLHH